MGNFEISCRPRKSQWKLKDFDLFVLEVISVKWILEKEYSERNNIPIKQIRYRDQEVLKHHRQDVGNKLSSLVLRLAFGTWKEENVTSMHI